ncbi:putative Lectin C-type domain-containing protein 9 [Homarus americanus]|uniref:Putative Lectin C-type domain-containing protein 9 n=1 Tax=Homarus americanus TaxID=6706 RepID=A0A8J5N5P3_HOMAM|nr:putative Lectin C-type domain-containing protein 9 [Homarus americanus]
MRFIKDTEFQPVNTEPSTEGKGTSWHTRVPAMVSSVRKRIPVFVTCALVFVCVFVTVPVVLLLREKQVKEVLVNATITSVILHPESDRFQNGSGGSNQLPTVLLNATVTSTVLQPGGSERLQKGSEISTNLQMALQSTSNDTESLQNSSETSTWLESASNLLEWFLSGWESLRPSRGVATCAAVDDDVCEPGYTKFQNQCYKVLKTESPIDFSSAQRQCQGDGAALATDKTPQVHNFLKGLLKPHLSETIDSQYRRAFIGLMCQNGCDSPGNWLYADGTKCEGNHFCDWLTIGSTNEWNALPTSLYGPSIAAMLDDFPDTSYRYKLQPYPADHTLQYMICEKEADSTEHLKPRQLTVNERVSNVVLQWRRPACSGEISSYILVLLGGTVSYDTEMRTIK